MFPKSLFYRRFFLHSHRNYATASRQELYQRCYLILGVDENADQNTVRRKYIELVKQVHPDSGHPDASAERFHDVDQAFKVLQAKFAKSRRGIVEDMEVEVQVFDIKHTAPQHRQYLSYEGYGSGTIFQRERQYQQQKAMKAQERVMEHRLHKAQATEAAVMKKGDFYKRHAIKTKYGFDRVVEDLIQEAMSRGDFQNIKGSGKPIKDVQSQYPYVDFVTFKMNKILSDNGFVPEWISLHKEIREGICDLKLSLTNARQQLGEVPLSDEDKTSWEGMIEDHQEMAKKINKKIDDFNLIVPIMDKQMVRIQLTKICDKILSETKLECKSRDEASNLSNVQQHDAARQTGLVGLIGALFSSS